MDDGLLKIGLLGRQSPCGGHKRICHDTQSGIEYACGLGDEGSIERELLLLEKRLLLRLLEKGLLRLLLDKGLLRLLLEKGLLLRLLEKGLLLRLLEKRLLLA